MVVGAVPFVAAALALIRDLPGAHTIVIPNVDARPETLLAGAALCAFGAFTRRRLSVASPRPNEELKPTAPQSSLVE